MNSYLLGAIPNVSINSTSEEVLGQVSAMIIIALLVSINSTSEEVLGLL